MILSFHMNSFLYFLALLPSIPLLIFSQGLRQNKKNGMIIYLVICFLLISLLIFLLINDIIGLIDFLILMLNFEPQHQFQFS